MKFARPLLTLIVLAQLAPGLALAQDRPAGAGGQAPAAGSPAPASSAPAPLTAAQVTPPTVSDPLLEPVPPPAKVVSTWREALSMVKSRSTDLRVSLLDLSRAEAQARVALGAALPPVSASANVTRQLIRSVVDPISGSPSIQSFPPRAVTYGGSLTASIPLFAPRAWHNIGTAEQQQRVAEMSISEQRRVLAAAVADALVAVISAERVAELNRVGLRNALERLALTRRRAELGVANALDVLRVEQDAATARGAIVTGDENLRQARESFGLALGFPEAFGVPRDMNIDAFAQESERACPRIGSIEERSDVAVARERVVLARRGVRDVELSFLPTIDLRTVYSVSIQPFYNDFSKNPQLASLGIVDRQNTLHSWSIAGVLSWNIFDGGSRYGSLRDNRIQTEQAEVRVEAARRAAQIQVQRALRGVEVADTARKVATETRNLARETDRLTRVSFDLGKGTSLELVDAGRALRQTEIQLALREFDQVQAKIRALLALSTCDY
jgi:outer membrane protein, multidrug efflux system